MKQVATSFILTLCIVFAASGMHYVSVSLYAQEKSAIGSKEHIILIAPAHPADDISCEGWREQMSFREITNWARAYGLKALRPEGSPEGIRASFVSKHGSKVIIKKLDPVRRYYLRVHFVNYAQLTETDIHAFLEIRADREHIARLSFADAMKKSEPLVFEIPCHLTMDGKLTLEFREYSSSGGFFGIWHMALSDSFEKPNIFIAPLDTQKMIEPNSLIDKAGVTPQPSIEKPENTANPGSSKDNTASPTSPNIIPSPEKTAKADIRARKPGAINKKDGKQKESEARKMLQDDKKKDVRAQ